MAIDIKENKKRNLKLPTSFNILFYYSIALFIFSVSGYLLVSQWNSEMQAQIENREEIIRRLENEENLQENRSLISDYQNQVRDYSYLFSEKRNVDNLFLLIESILHPSSHLESMRMDASEKTLFLEGRTLNFKTLEQQHSILKNFKMKRNVSGWVQELDLSEEEEDLRVSSENLQIYNSPVGREIVQTLDESQGKEVEKIKKVNEDDYIFTGSRRQYGLIDGTWYEVVIPSEIKPIDEVDLADISEREDDFEVGFEFRINLNKELFK